LVADLPFDPNATFRSSAASTPPSTPPPATPPSLSQTVIDKASAPTQTDFGATIATSSSAPTAVLPKDTGPTGARTIVDRAAPAAPASVAPVPAQQTSALPKATPSVPIRPPRAETKSKMPLIVGILLVLLVLGAGAVAAVFFLVIKPRLNEVRSEPVATTPTKTETTNSNTSVTVEKPKTEPEFVAPPNTVKFENSNAGLDGKLAEHYFDFSFYYPSSWTVVPKSPSGAASFVKVERRLPPDFTQENFAVGWYDNSKGTFAADEAGFKQRVEDLSNRLAKTLPEYRKVSEGPVKVNSLDGYEFRFVSLSKGTEKGDLQLWGRVIFLPRGEGESTGAILSMLTTSLAPELSGVDDVGQKGELPVVLESFRFGKKP